MFNKQSSSLNGTVAKSEQTSPSKSKTASSPDRASSNLDTFNNYNNNTSNNQSGYIQPSETFPANQTENPSSPPAPSNNNTNQNQQFFDYHRLNQGQNPFDRHHITSTMNVNVSMNFNGNAAAAAAVAAAAAGQTASNQSGYYQPQQNIDIYQQHNYLNNPSVNSNVQQQVTNSTNEQESVNQPIAFSANNLGI